MRRSGVASLCLLAACGGDAAHASLAAQAEPITRADISSLSPPSPGPAPERAPIQPDVGLALDPPAPAIWPAFEDVSDAAGLDAIHVANLLHSAIGQAWGDFDGDGLLDLYVTGGMAPSRLFLNAGDGTFISAEAGPATLEAASTAGAAWGDFDNDGDDDLVVTTAGPNHVFRNDDGVSLVDVTPGSGLAGTDMTSTASWGDFDLDACLDLYVVNHGLDPDQLYRGHCDGTFTDVTHRLPGSSAFRPAFAAAFTDVDHDGTIDVYVVNDHHFGNDLFRGTGRGWFQDISVRSGAGIEIYGMGLAIGDYDLDLDLDFFMSDIWASNLLASTHSQGHTGFVDVSDEAGVNFEDAISWGCDFLDFDNDGWPDLYMATNHPEPWRSNRVWRNQGDGTFEDVSEISGASDPGWSYGAVVADYDEDGRVDVVVGNRGSGYRLYRNRGTVGADNHWVELDLHGGGPVNRDALGARAWVTDSSGITRMNEVRSGSTMGGGSSTRLHFGLGNATVVRIEVRWPDGTIGFPKPRTNGIVTFSYGD
jgi:hypothetical protein